MLRGALAQHRGFSRESPNNLGDSCHWGGFSTVTVPLLCRCQQWDMLRSTWHGFFVTCPIYQSALSWLIGKYVRSLLN